jgi:3-oxoacyl-[acyl-carrier protein] reductase
MPSERYLEGKVAWITGSSRGIGHAIALHLATLGARVAVHGSSPQSPCAFGEGTTLDDVARAIAEASGSKVIAVCGDLTDEARVKALADEVRARFGQIDILVNCAGGDIGSRGTGAPNAGKPTRNDAVFIALEDLRAVLDRNLLTCILACREVAPEMMARRAGRIVTIGSIAALFGHEQSAIYATAKAAVHEYSRCLAMQLRPYDVAVNVVAPGDTVTERFKASRPVEEAMMVETGTLERYGWPLEIARAVAYFCADDTTYITGQVLRVDGGKQTWPA